MTTVSQNTVTLKQGDTLRWLCTFEINGVVQNLTGVQVKAAIRMSSQQLYPLVVTVQNQSTNLGQFEVYSPSTSTSLFPVGMLSCDLEYTLANGDKISSETFTVKVLRQITL